MRKKNEKENIKSNENEFVKEEPSTSKAKNKFTDLDNILDWNILGLALIWIFLFITFF